MPRILVASGRPDDRFRRGGGCGHDVPMSASMDLSMELGRSGLRVPRLGVGAMVWGDMSAAPRWNPARQVYGPSSSAQDQREALEASLAGGVSLIDTAAVYGAGASERRVGELTEG